MFKYYFPKLKNFLNHVIRQHVFYKLNSTDKDCVVHNHIQSVFICVTVFTNNSQAQTKIMYTVCMLIVKRTYTWMHIVKLLIYEWTNNMYSAKNCNIEHNLHVPLWQISMDSICTNLKVALCTQIALIWKYLLSVLSIYTLSTTNHHATQHAHVIVTIHQIDRFTGTCTWLCCSIWVVITHKKMATGKAWMVLTKHFQSLKSLTDYSTTELLCDKPFDKKGNKQTKWKDLYFDSKRFQTLAKLQ